MRNSYYSKKNGIFNPLSYVVIFLLSALFLLIQIPSCDKAIDPPTSKLDVGTIYVGNDAVTANGVTVYNTELKPRLQITYTLPLAASTLTPTSYTVTNTTTGQTADLVLSLTNNNLTVVLQPSVDLSPVFLYKVDLSTQVKSSSGFSITSSPNLNSFFFRVKSVRTPPADFLSNPVISAIGKDSATISWQHSGDFGKDSFGNILRGAIPPYTILYSTNGGVTFVDLPSTIRTIPSPIIATTRSVKMIGLTPGTEYVFKVRAQNTENATSLSNEVKASTLSAAAAPDGVIYIVRAASTDTNNLTIAWTRGASFGLTSTGILASLKSYEITYATNNPSGPFGNANVSHANLTDTFATIRGLNTKGLYYFRITTTNSVDLSSTVTTNMGFKTDQSTPPAKPSSITITPSATGLSTASLEFRISPNYSLATNLGKDPIGNFNRSLSLFGISYKKSTDANYSLPIAINPGTTQVPILNGLTPNTEYDIRIIVQNNNAPGFNADTLFLPRQLTASALSAPTSKIITRRSSNATSITIEWTAPASFGKNPDGTEASPAATPYTVKFSPTRTGAYAAVSSVDQTNRTATLSSTVTGANEYFFIVTAANNVGQSSSDTTITPFRADQSEKPVVSAWASRGNGSTPSTVTLNWDPMGVSPSTWGKKDDGTPAAPATASAPLIVEISTDNGATWTAAIPTSTLIGNSTTATIAGLQANTQYTFRLKAVNDNPTGLFSSAYGVNVQVTTLQKMSISGTSGSLVYTPATQDIIPGTVGNSTPTITPGAATVTYSITYNGGTTLPSGFNFDIATGKISYASTVAIGSYSFSVVARGTGDYDGTQTATYVLNVKTPLTSISYQQGPNSLSLVKGQSGNSGIPILTPNGATVQYSATYQGSTTLPIGISIDPNTGGIVANSVAAGTYVLTITATGTGTYQGTVQIPYTITVSKISLSAISYSTNTASVGYTSSGSSSVTPTITASSGNPLSTDVDYTLTGVPTGVTGITIGQNGQVAWNNSVPVGTYVLTVTAVAKTSGDYQGTIQTTFTLTVNSIALSSVSYATNTLTVARTGKSNSVAPTLSPSGGTPTATYSLTSAVPNGVSINPSTGVINYDGTTPSPAGTYNLTVTATGNGNYTGSVTTNYTIVLTP